MVQIDRSLLVYRYRAKYHTDVSRITTMAQYQVTRTAQSRAIDWSMQQAHDVLVIMRVLGRKRGGHSITDALMEALRRAESAEMADFVERCRADP